MATVFLNGSFITQDDARISAFDAGLQHGVGLFETMTGEHSQGRARVFRMEEHLSRLAQSARELGLSDQIQVGALAEAVLDTLKRSGLPLARIRLTITGGDLNLLGRGKNGAGPIRPTILI